MYIARRISKPVPHLCGQGGGTFKVGRGTPNLN